MNAEHAAASQRITRADLDWWLNFAPTLDWIFATTYAATAPHHYIVEGKTPGLTKGDLIRAARVIRTFGEPAKFYHSTNIYLTSPDGLVKWWGMDADVTKTTLINRADAHHLYGPQNAPRTSSQATLDHDSPFDEVASHWDGLHPISGDVTAFVQGRITERLGKRPRRLLDIGCGTGAALDAELTDPVHYVGVDPSRAMLNELVRKHPHTAWIHPITLNDAVSSRVLGSTHFDAVVALGGSASHLSPAEIGLLRDLSLDLIVMMHYVDDRCFPGAGVSPEYAAASLAAARELSHRHNGIERTIDGFIITVI